MTSETDVRCGAGRLPTRIVMACLTAVVAVVPTLFWIRLEETFAIPKLVALAVVVAVGAIAASVAMVTATSSEHRVLVVDIFVAAYALAVAISFAVSIDRELSLLGERLQRQGLVPTLLYVALYGFARLAIVDGRRLGVIIRSAAGGATFVAIYAVIQRVGLDPIWSALPQGRVFSTIGQANSLGAYLAMTIPLAVASAAVERRRVARGLWWAAVAVQAPALLFTLSRGAYLALAVALTAGFVIPSFARISRYRGRVLAAAGVAAVAVVAFTASSSTFSETGGRAIARTFSVDDFRSGSIRDHLDLWKTAVVIAADHPAFGTGPDTFPESFDDYRDEVLDSDRAQRFAPYRVESAHNVFLTAAAGSGIAAALALGAALLAGVGVGLRRHGNRGDEQDGTLLRATGAALLAYVIANSFITAELAGSSTAWILLGGAVTVSTRIRSASDQHHGRRSAEAVVGTEHS